MPSKKQQTIDRRKMDLIRRTAQNRIDDRQYLYLLYRYISLSYESLETICSFTSNDWWLLGACNEVEYLDNREEEDKAIRNTHGEEDKWYLLTEELFNKQIGKQETKLTYNLYLHMRLAELRIV